jgi:hypothetical protein
MSLTAQSACSSPCIRSEADDHLASSAGHRIRHAAGRHPVESSRHMDRRRTDRERSGNIHLLFAGGDSVAGGYQPESHGRIPTVRLARLPRCRL